MTDHLLPWPEGYGRIILGEVDSTMAEAQRRAPTLDRGRDAHGLAVLCDRAAGDVDAFHGRQCR